MGTDSLNAVTGVEHGGSKHMTTHRTRHSAVRRRHLSLAAPVAPETRPTSREIRATSRIAALLRRRAARLPEDSVLRAELMETAEYYATYTSWSRASGGTG
jgi:hypothetical protein